MTYDVTIKPMSQDVPTHLLLVCDKLEDAVEQARQQYPGGLIINVLIVD